MYGDYVNIPSLSGKICTAVMKVGIANAVWKILFATMEELGLLPSADTVLLS
jgi:hypothetical protein